MEKQIRKAIKSIIKKGGLVGIAAQYCLGNPRKEKLFISRCKRDYLRSEDMRVFWGPDLVKQIEDLGEVDSIPC
jgi:hypothetical protein